MGFSLPLLCYLLSPLSRKWVGCFSLNTSDFYLLSELSFFTDSWYPGHLRWSITVPCITQYSFLLIFVVYIVIYNIYFLCVCNYIICHKLKALSLLLCCNGETGKYFLPWVFSLPCKEVWGLESDISSIALLPS